MVDLTTTNILLGVMAVVSVLEAIALIVGGILALRLYRDVNAQLQVLEQRHVQPLTAQAAAILDTVQRISAHVEHSTTRVDAAVQGTLERAEDAVDRVQGGARRAADTVVGIVRGVRTAIHTFRTNDTRLSNAVPGADVARVEPPPYRGAGSEHHPASHLDAAG